MKKVIVIAICVLGIISIASCRSTSNTCGLSENKATDEMPNHESEEMLFV